MARSLAVAITLLAAPAAAQVFQIDLGAEEYLSRAYPAHLGDAAPGETVRIGNDFLCHRDGALFVHAAAPMLDDEDFAWQARVEPGKPLAIEARLGRYPATDAETLAELEIVFLWQHCDDYALTRDADLSRLLPVGTVNGAKSLSALLGG